MSKWPPNEGIFSHTILGQDCYKFLILFQIQLAILVIWRWKVQLSGHKEMDRRSVRYRRCVKKERAISSWKGVLLYFFDTTMIMLSLEFSHFALSYKRLVLKYLLFIFVLLFHRLTTEKDVHQFRFFLSTMRTPTFTCVRIGSHLNRNAWADNNRYSWGGST